MTISRSNVDAFREQVRDGTGSGGFEDDYLDRVRATQVRGGHRVSPQWRGGRQFQMGAQERSAQLGDGRSSASAHQSY